MPISVKPSTSGQINSFGTRDATETDVKGLNSESRVAGAEPDLEDHGGVDAFTLSMRLRYLDSMDGFDGRLTVA